jgi:hypothetical protein
MVWPSGSSDRQPDFRLPTNFVHAAQFGQRGHESAALEGVGRTVQDQAAAERFRFKLRRDLRQFIEVEGLASLALDPGLEFSRRAQRSVKQFGDGHGQQGTDEEDAGARHVRRSSSRQPMSRR